MTDIVYFNVKGDPTPKQSFRIGRNGNHYQSRDVVGWQMLVKSEASLVMGRLAPMAGPLAVTIDFYLPDRRRRDLDNLSKAVLDACNKVVWQDDTQIEALKLFKWFGRSEPGVTVTVMPINGNERDVKG